MKQEIRILAGWDMTFRRLPNVGEWPIYSISKVYLQPIKHYLSDYHELSDEKYVNKKY